MAVQPRPLVEEWDILCDQVVPALLQMGERGRGVAVWATGGLVPAVLLAAAFAERGGAFAEREGASAERGGAFAERAGSGGADLAVFTGVVPDRPYLTLGDIRAVPSRVRRRWFQRSERGWAPKGAVAGWVLLGPPRPPVDLVMGDAAEGDRVLRPGGLLLLPPPPLGVPPSPAGLESPAGGRFRVVGAGGRLLEREGAGPAAAGSTAVRQAAAGPADEPVTLAEYQERADLVSDHVTLARSLARRFTGRGEQRDDLEQVALLALMKAAGRYQWNRDVSFSTFATATVLGEIKRHFRDKAWMMRVPRALQETYLLVKEANATLSQELGSSPTIPQIAERLGVSDEAVLEAIEAGESFRPDSLDVGLHEDDGHRDVPILDGTLDAALERADLQRLLPLLTDRERLLLRRIYLDELSQREVAGELGVSQMQVSRLLRATVSRARRLAATAGSEEPDPRRGRPSGPAQPA